MKCAKRQNGDLQSNMLRDEKPEKTDHRVTDMIGSSERWSEAPVELAEWQTGHVLQATAAQLGGGDGGLGKAS
jgi:hypothetical protein